MRRFVAALSGVLVVAAGLVVSAAASSAVVRSVAAQSAAGRAPTVQAGSFHPVNSTRVLDTRRLGGLASGGVLRPPVAGAGAIPVDASAVTVNVTVLAPARSGSISVFPGDQAWNGSASISFGAGLTKQSMITAVLGSNGTLAVRNNIGARIQVIFDVVGYSADRGHVPSAPGAFYPLGIRRVFDTRAAGSHPLQPGQANLVQIGGNGGVPTTGVAAVVANVTVISPARAGTLSAYPFDAGWNTGTSISFAAGRSEQDVLSVGIGDYGAIGLRNASSAPVQVVVDVIGYYLDGTPVDYGSYQSIPSYRVLDERLSGQHPIAPGGTASMLPTQGINNVTYHDPPPAWGLAASVVRFTVLTPAHAGSVSVYRADQAWNGAASISFPAGISVQQQLTTPLGPNQALLIRNNTAGPLTLVADVLGYYRGVPAPSVAGSVNFERPGGPLRDVSCASATFCMVSELPGRVETWNGTAWSKPSVVPPASQLMSLSCLSATFCMAAGWADANRHIEVFRYDGTSWTAQASLVYQWGRYPRVSCASTSFCLVVGSIGYRTFDGTGWSAEQPFQPAQPSYDDQVIGLTCVSASFCMAVTVFNRVYRFDGTGWSAPLSIAGLTKPSTVSCTSATFCLAGDSLGNVASYDGTSWAVTPQVSPHPISWASCASSTDCRVVDNTGTVFRFDGQAWSIELSSHFTASRMSCAPGGTCVLIDADYLLQDGEAMVFDGTSWGSAHQIQFGPYGGGGVSCVSTSFCMAIDVGGWAASYDGTGWNTEVFVADQGDQLEAVSCGSSSSCVAVDDHGKAYHYDGTAWSAAMLVEPGGWLSSVSCPSPVWCVAVDYQGNASTFNGSSWSAPASIDSNLLTGVSCPSTSFCAAVDNAGQAVTFNGSSWSASQPTGAQRLTGISCTSSGFCLALGAGQAARWNGAHWVGVGVPANQDAGQLSCTSAQSCLAITPNLSGGTVPNAGTMIAWDGTEWSMPTSMTASNAVSCANASWCLVLDDNTATTLTG